MTAPMTDEELSDITGHDDPAISDMAAELLAARARIPEMEVALRMADQWTKDEIDCPWGDIHAIIVKALAQPAESGAKVAGMELFDEQTIDGAQVTPAPPVPQEPGDKEVAVALSARLFGLHRKDRHKAILAAIRAARASERAQAEARVKELEAAFALRSELYERARIDSCNAAMESDALRARLETAVADEREACARIVDHWRGCDAIAAAIRARASEAEGASRAGAVPND